MRHNMIETVMGAIVLVIAGFFLVFAYQGGRVTQKGGYEVEAKFERIDGIKVGSDVRMSGVNIGTVTKLMIDSNTFLARVHLRIDERYALPKDTSAEVVSDGLLGSKYIALVPGGDEVTIPPGGEIAYTQASISIESLVGKMIFGDKEDDKN